MFEMFQQSNCHIFVNAAAIIDMDYFAANLRQHGLDMLCKLNV